MAGLMCLLCDNSWEQEILGIISCPRCEIGAAPYVFTNVSNDEISTLWAEVNI